MMRQWKSLRIGMSMWRSFATDEDGATAVEYGLLVALIGLTIMSTISNTGQAIKTELYDQIAATLASMSK